MKLKKTLPGLTDVKTGASAAARRKAADFAAEQVHHFLHMTRQTVNSGPKAEQIEEAPIAAGGLVGLMRYMVQGGATVEQIQRQFSTALEEALPRVLVEFGAK